MKNLSQAQRAALQFFDASEDVDLNLFPTFLIAGPQRTGSTWIYTQIQDHPQIQMTDPKEVYYFNLLKQPDHPQHETDDLAVYLRHFSRTSEAFKKRDRECRQRFGRPFDPVARGDATASYAAGIDEPRMAELVNIAPEIRVIITVRNPIDRAWSHAKLQVERQRGKGSMAEEDPGEIEKVLNWDYNRSCGLYTEMHERWSRHLRDGHLMFRAFDEIATRPREFLLDVLRFLQVEDDPRYLRADSDAGANRTRSSSKIPERFARQLVDMYRDEIERLRERFGIGTAWTLPT